MKNNIIEEVINNMTSTSEALQAFIHDPSNYNISGCEILSRFHTEIVKTTKEIKQLQHDYRF